MHFPGVACGDGLLQVQRCALSCCFCAVSRVQEPLCTTLCSGSQLDCWIARCAMSSRACEICERFGLQQGECLQRFRLPYEYAQSDESCCQLYPCPTLSGTSKARRSVRSLPLASVHTPLKSVSKSGGQHAVNGCCRDWQTQGHTLRCRLQDGANMYRQRGLHMHPANA